MITQADIEAAAARLAGRIRPTPLLRLAAGELGLPSAAVLKLELLQHTGSFKPRGAFNRMLAPSLPGAPLPNSGVIAASGGNHGAAVAYAARALGVPAEIFVPESTPQAKLDRIASYGARVIRGGASYAEAYAACQTRQAETGALDVHAYDHDAVLAGQGTVGREFAQQAPEITHLLVATGGGGLIGGIAAWYQSQIPIISVEPESCPCLHDALAAGHPVPAPVGGYAADALGARQCGERMFAVARHHVAQAVLVTDTAIRDAQQALWSECRILAEPGGATALAALRVGAFTPPPGAIVGVLVCGGNTNPASLAA